jgi:hypothetical protein
VWKLVLIPQIDANEFPLYLPPPNSENSGGYIKYNYGTIYDYSPIDIVVAGVEAIYRDELVTNLPNFFRKYPIRQSDTELVIGVKTDRLLIIDTISRLKTKLYLFDGLIQILRKNAPLTFKE